MLMVAVTRAAKEAKEMNWVNFMVMLVADVGLRCPIGFAREHGIRIMALVMEERRMLGKDEIRVVVLSVAPAFSCWSKN